MHRLVNVVADRRFQQIRIVSAVLMLIFLTGCAVSVRRKEGWPVLTEERSIPSEEAFLEHQLFEKIDLGMTKEEVLKSCGKPQKISKTDAGEVWFWNKLTISPRSSRGGDEHELSLDSWRVELHFDNEGILYSAGVEQK